MFFILQVNKPVITTIKGTENFVVGACVGNIVGFLVVGLIVGFLKQKKTRFIRLSDYQKCCFQILITNIVGFCVGPGVGLNVS